MNTKNHVVRFLKNQMSRYITRHDGKWNSLYNPTTVMDSTFDGYWLVICLSFMAYQPP